jgi:hypothetical protein
MTGNYDIFWELETSGDTVPFNNRARIGSNVSVATGQLDIDMSSHQVSGSFTLNGGAFPGTIQNTGQIVFRDQITGTENVLALTADGGYDHRVVKGIYDIVYQHLQGAQVPQNKNALLSEGLIVKSAVVVDVNVPSRLFAAPVYHNGVLFPASQQQSANMLVRNLDSGDLAFIGKTSLQNLSALLIPGTYDVYYSHLSGDEIPRNTMARILEGLVVEAPGPVLQGGGGGIQLDVTSVQITGQMLLNDAPMPASEYDDGELSLRREEDSVLLANTHDQSYQVRVVNQADWAEFRVHYGVETPGEKIPLNGDTVVMCIVLDPIIF